MNIVKIIGGLGNQMSQYAFFEALLHHDKSAKMDISFFKNYSLHNGYELESLFPIKKEYSSSGEAESLGDFNSSFLSRVRRKVGITKNTYYVEREYSYKENIFELDGMYFDGYWQSYKYFDGIEEILQERFTFPSLKDERNLKVLDKILASNSVSIHIRRGDYLRSPLHRGIANLSYYNKALNYIHQHIENPIFFVFSDDIAWAKKKIGVSNAYYIDWNNGEKSYIDMQLMSLCKHNIIPNSTFSWWGAWLNVNPKKTVITPQKWLNKNKIKIDDVVLPSWIKIP